MTVALITKGYICQPEYVLQFSMDISAELSNCDIPCDECSQPILKRGNSVTLLFLVTADGVRLTNAQLSAAENIIFAVKEDPQDLNAEALILKESLLGGVTILPDGDNQSPNLQVNLTSSDTNIPMNSYPTGLQIKFAADDCKEADLSFDSQCFSRISFEQDVVRCA